MTKMAMSWSTWAAPVLGAGANPVVRCPSLRSPGHRRSDGEATRKSPGQRWTETKVLISYGVSAAPEAPATVGTMKPLEPVTKDESASGYFTTGPEPALKTRVSGPTQKDSTLPSKFWFVTHLNLLTTPVVRSAGVANMTPRSKNLPIADLQFCPHENDA